MNDRALHKGVRYFGVFLTPKGAYAPFVTRDRTKAPPTTVDIRETTRPGTDVPKMADRLCEEYRTNGAPCSPEPKYDIDDLKPGTVAFYEDDEVHLAIILAIARGEAHALFFTSKPHWARACRRATRDELALAAFHHRRTTYLASVVRPIAGFRSMRFCIPKHRVESLRREFPTSVAS